MSQHRHCSAPGGKTLDGDGSEILGICYKSLVEAMAEVPGTSSSTLNVTPVPHLAIAAWLHGIKLDQYESLLRNFHEVEDLLDLNTVDLLRLGIKNSAHRCRIIGSLRILREKDRRAPNCTKTNVSEAVTARTLFTRTTGDSTARGKDDSRQDAMSTLTRVGEETIEENYWYHGAIGRARAEALVLYSGDFLVSIRTSRLRTILKISTPIYFSLID
ncbi:unnamed protein product [Soboliphyme baturini]|uniref:SAM domain-containing protein n=1 Tax=Soboliphyme baturini TaxID=241478 RepID=A0A183IFI8_9BILA|nr:unnamed protein product [Soboliphyme baturini]